MLRAPALEPVWSRRRLGERAERCWKGWFLLVAVLPELLLRREALVRHWLWILSPAVPVRRRRLLVVRRFRL